MAIKKEGGGRRGRPPGRAHGRRRRCGRRRRGGRAAAACVTRRSRAALAPMAAHRTHAPSTPQPSTPQPSTLNPPPSTLNPQPSTLNPEFRVGVQGQGLGFRAPPHQVTRWCYNCPPHARALNPATLKPSTPQPCPPGGAATASRCNWCRRT